MAADGLSAARGAAAGGYAASTPRASPRGGGGAARAVSQRGRDGAQCACAGASLLALLFTVCLLVYEAFCDGAHGARAGAS